MKTSISGLSVSNKNLTIALYHKTPGKIILSVPHDGLTPSDFSGAYKERARGNKLNDLQVWPIAMTMLSSGETDWRGEPLLVDAVRFLVPRAYIDANRPLQSETASGAIALEDRRLLPAYHHYHRTLRFLIERSIKAHGKKNILLIDLHGFSKQPLVPKKYDLFFGTGDRGTIQHEKCGSVSFPGWWYHNTKVDNGIDIFLSSLTELDSNRYSCFFSGLTNTPGIASPYNAGYITRHYSKRYGIDAIQIEIAKKFRDLHEEGVAERGQKLGKDLMWSVMRAMTPLTGKEWLQACLPE